VKNNIKQLLDGRPVTWLASRSNVPRTTINTYIKGGTPLLDKAYAIAQAFGVAVYEVWPRD
jgi:transcriptional regulator with XRE-family HTH domain